MEVSQFYREYCQNNSDQKDDLVILHEFSRQTDRICFLDSMSQLLVYLSTEAKIGTNLENKDTMMFL